ncbi:hypothetical protein ACL02S_05525 [Nocardia sp. 004]|uniref:hypothetical protein n=1 Tax=Nocardia sp. 004 TaxID=3385978 RepID=UPI0039A1A039
MELFRRHIGHRVVFVPPAGPQCGAIEHGVIIAVDHRMVYVDYGYPNPVWPELGNSIATHPGNLRLKPVTMQMKSTVAKYFSHSPRNTLSAEGSAPGPLFSAT